MKTTSTDGIRFEYNGSDTGFRTFYPTTSYAAGGTGEVISFTLPGTHPVIGLGMHVFFNAARTAPSYIESYGREQFSFWLANTNSNWGSEQLSWARSSHGNAIVSPQINSNISASRISVFQNGCSTTNHSQAMVTVYCNNWAYITTTYY